MKKTILFIGTMMMLAFSACTDAGNGVAKDTVTTKEEPHHHETEAALTLHNGQKWKVDDATRTNVAGLQQVVSGFGNLENKTTGDYASLGNTLSDSLNNLISECRMKGADHEALHQWLEPLASSVAELKNAATTADAEIIFKKITERLEIFGTYFE